MHEMASMDVLEKKPRFTDRYVVTVQDADCHQQLKLSAMCNLMQETSRRHADHMGIGYDLMQQINHAWMLYDLRLEIDRHPVAGETIQVETWSRGINGLTALRDFRLLDQAGGTIARASTSWLLLDRLQQRPRPIGNRFPMLLDCQGTCPTSKASSKIVLPLSLTKLDERQVRFNEIDLNNHVNNAQYLAWIEDAVGSFLHDGQRLVTIELNFVASACLGERVVIQGTHAPACPNCRDDEPETQFISIHRADGGNALVRAALEWAN